MGDPLFHFIPSSLLLGSQVGPIVTIPGNTPGDVVSGKKSLPKEINKNNFILMAYKGEGNPEAILPKCVASQVAASFSITAQALSFWNIDITDQNYYLWLHAFIYLIDFYQIS